MPKSQVTETTGTRSLSPQQRRRHDDTKQNGDRDRMAVDEPPRQPASDAGALSKAMGDDNHGRHEPRSNGPQIPTHPIFTAVSSLDLNDGPSQSEAAMPPSSSSVDSSAKKPQPSMLALDTPNYCPVERLIREAEHERPYDMLREHSRKYCERSQKSKDDSAPDQSSTGFAED